MLKKTIRFFDKLEDKVRHKLSRQPLWYALIGGIGIVLFWRGVWHSADFLSNEFLDLSSGGRLSNDLHVFFLMDGLVSMAIGAVLLLMSGVFVSSLIGNEVILTGLKGEKKIAEKTEEEVETELEKLKSVEKEMKGIAEKLSKIECKIVDK